MKYKIEDWAGNEIKKKSKNGLWVEMTFKTFQAAWDYIYTKFPNGEEDGTFENLYVVPMES